jgi:hypothetical protein
MRTEFTNADLADFVRQYVRIPKDIDTRLNRDAARVELRTLISTGVAILNRPANIAPGVQNAALNRISEACFSLEEAFRDGYDAMLQQSGYREGVAHEISGPEAKAFSLLQRTGPILDALANLVTVPEIPVRRGAPPDDRRAIFLEECARYFTRWTGKKIAASRGSRFSNFAQALFSTMKIADENVNLSWQINRMLKNI